ncbi:hypothetical protein KO498_15080 [Lentibacter algarum]|uniref:DUF6636 domain-containing protein n=1 Tax=Lentibacter algarum TaxID=576131 RepID=UPI001C0949AB|nr:DUF6636 domain-containing protein [Lentibacter algarum]MBU2983133.1 hypothetical protein [Lentibacter algarum]
MGRSLRLILGLALAVIGTWASAESTGFKAPSGNILCYTIDRDWDTDALLPESQRRLACLVWEVQWSPPLDFGDDDLTCDLDQTRIVLLPYAGRGNARWVCHGDVFWPLPLPKLGYGSSWNVSGFNCSMAKDGVRCSNSTGNGFHIRRAKLKFN